MRVSLASSAAAAAILLLLCAGYALSVRNAVDLRMTRVLDTETARLNAELASETHRLDMAGRQAAALVSRLNDYDAARDVVAAAAGDWLVVEGVASFELRESGPKLRRAEPVFSQDAAPPPNLAEHVMTLRSEAFEAVKAAAPRFVERGPEAVFSSPQEQRSTYGRSFWLFWLSGGDRALGLRVSLRETPQRALVNSLAVAAASVHIEPLHRDTPDDWRNVARLGDHAVGLTLVPAPAKPTREDLLTALATFGPSLACALLLGGLFLGYARRAERRAAVDSERCAEMLLSIEAQQSELDRSEEKFRHLAESTNVIPWSADLEHQRFTYVGPQIEELSGYSGADWLATGFWALHVHPDDRQRVLVDAVSRASGGRYTTVDYRVRGANGAMLHVRNMLSASEEIDERTGQRRQVAHGFLLDVTELRRAAEALEEARCRAEEANRVKSEFLANMSHELRTPLNAVIGFSEIMKEQLFGPLDARYRDYAESVHASGKHLLSLINDVLDLSKIEAGRVELTEDRADIAEMLSNCRTLLQERVASAGLTAKLTLGAELPQMKIDERRIKQVVLNLLSNAIKFTEPGGEIEIGAERMPGRGVRLWVRDSGVGMSAAQIPKALEQFGQVDGDLDRKHQGTGLGLPIAKSLVEMHGGKFEIKSAPGKGTMVSLRLPEDRVVKATQKRSQQREMLTDALGDA